MVEINSIEDLRPFMKYVPAKYVNGYFSCLSFEIVENGEVQDVTINCELDLTFSMDNVFCDLFNVENMIAEDRLAEFCEIRLIAKNIYVKQPLKIEHIKCDNIYFDQNVTIDVLVAYGNVKGESIHSTDIMCDSLNAKYVYCNCINALKFRARCLFGGDVFMENVTFHNPDFPEDLVNSWNGVKRDRYDLTKNIDSLPF